MLRTSRNALNVFDPFFMRNIKKAFGRYKDSMDQRSSQGISREAFVDIDDKGAAWYLGHMKKASVDLKSKIKDVDFVLEIRDARLPFTTENPELRKIIGDKPHLIVFNKAELANEDCNLAVQRYYEANGSFALFTNARRTWRDTVEAVQKFVAHCLPNKPFQTSAQVGLVVGMPNVGKSTLINSLRMAHEYQFHREDFHRSRTGQSVSMEPGTTRALQLVPICKEPRVVLYDSPGLTLPGCFAKEAGLKLAACGIIPLNDLTLTSGIVARYLYDVMIASGASEHMAECLHLPRAPVSFDDCIALLCERSGRSSQTDLGNLHPKHAQGFIIHDFQLGKLGKITLDRLPNKVKMQLASDGDPNAQRIAAPDDKHQNVDGDGEDTKQKGKEGGDQVDSDGSFVWTHHVETVDVKSRFPDHLRDVLEEVHYGSKVTAEASAKMQASSSTVRQSSQTSGQFKAKKYGNLRENRPEHSSDAFVISRKRGVISKVTATDDAVLRNIKLRPGR